MVLDNDTRGWILTILSGIACVVGASFTCVDIPVRLFTKRKNFRIQDSNAFLSSSLSLSAGVMLFSALYSMLPSSQSSLQQGHFSSKAAAWMLIGCFLGGAVGIQVLSRVFHRMLPSHVVDCDHSHDEEAPEHTHNHEGDEQGHRKRKRKGMEQVNEHDTGISERTPLLPTFAPAAEPQERALSTPQAPQGQALAQGTPKPPQRPPLPVRLSSRVSQLVSGSKNSCDQNGPCYGYSDPCGQECFKIVQSRGSRTPTANYKRHPWITRRSSTQDAYRHAPLHAIDETRPVGSLHAQRRKLSESALSHMQSTYSDSNALERADSTMSTLDESHSESPDTEGAKEGPKPHHHHVPKNAFLSIGLQVPIAIALHKLPEGFITYATNHANPKLGFAVFLALFIHNITEGFAMALPLYLAVNSKMKAILWTLVLGGFSQPLGAGVAALCFKVAGRTDFAPGEGLYGGMFAVTAGIMASVGLQLYAESLDLTHNKRLCMIFVFVGMGILGATSALTA